MQAKGVELSYWVEPNLSDPQEFGIESQLIMIQTSENRTRPQLPKLIGDKRRLLQVLINLIRNALKFTSNGYIDVKACYDERNRRLVVHVKDTGAGID